MVEDRTPKDLINVELEGRRTALPPGSTVLQLLEQEGRLAPAAEDPPVIASINGRRTSLADVLRNEDRLRLIGLRDPLAYTTVQRTVQFLALVAAEDLYPDVPLKIEFSLGGGMYCELQRPEPMTAEDVADLDRAMRDLVDRNLALTPQRFGMRALLKIFERRGETANLNATRYLRRDSLVLYSMEGSSRLYYGRQLPSTGYVRAFRLVPEGDGFVLLTGLKGEPSILPDYGSQPELRDTLRDYAAWTDTVGLADTGSVNEYIVRGRTAELIQISEARHTRFFVDAATQVADLPEEGRLVLLAGPSITDSK